MVDQHTKSDAEMSVAIENLRAMLDCEDIDLIIELLSTNNWDESLAASAFYARQMSQPQTNQQVTNQSQPA